ncbi:NAD(+) diphosphatase [Gammaproteobacteria bacterium]|nr:NAD(+) diphosphatase [Gammaproteobacteria bacterium]MDA7844058.1 NAD(+) diphosphatase [Gammaproteobacteria bacterium]
MHFNRFFDFKPENTNNLFIIFKDRKVLYDLDQKTFLLNSSYLKFEDYSFEIIGIGKEDDMNIYSVDISGHHFPLKEQGYLSLAEYEIRHLFPMLTPYDISVLGRGNQLMHWIKSNKHCGYCGAIKTFSESEEALFCKCNNIMVYPTISPCVLALIYKDNKILLARNSLFPEGLFSALAGFIEVSETAEECVEREVFEEVSLKVKNVKYFGSQSWPFPSQLMLAYICEYESGEINVDGKEIVEADWYDLDNLPNTPPNSTLSGTLINSYVSDHLKP